MTTQHSLNTNSTITAMSHPQASHNYPMASLHVSGLGPEVTEAVLFEKFAPIGQVLSIRVCRDFLSGQSLGYAYVNYQSSEDAERALDSLNFEKIGQRVIRIMWSQRDPSLRRSGVGNVFIKNLDKSIDHKVLYDTFIVFGNILSCKISCDQNGVSNGFGFVHFSSQESANNAIEKLNSKIILGKKIFVGKFIDRLERQSMGVAASKRFNNIYIKNFGIEFDTTEKLMNIFRQFGNITSALVVKDQQNNPKGFGFVCFDSSASAQAAVSAMNGRYLNNGKFLYVGRAQKKAERQEELKRRIEAFKRSAGTRAFQPVLRNPMINSRLNSPYHVRTANMNYSPMPHSPPLQSQQQPLLTYGVSGDLQDLGEQLYSAVAQLKSPQLAGKITAMLLELGHYQVVELLKNPLFLKSKIDEALKIINEHHSQQ